jgi:MOSC domain-containing protein YiiM
MVLAIYTATDTGSSMQPQDEVHAVPGRGLVGDRYFSGNGRFSENPMPGREITELTLIEGEVIEWIRREWQLDVNDRDSRRNLVTWGVALNELVGQEFSVGGVRLRGAGPCEPCVSLVKSPEHRHLLRALVHKGGLRAQILTEGAITIGDRVRLTPLVAVAGAYSDRRDYLGTASSL